MRSKLCVACTICLHNTQRIQTVHVKCSFTFIYYINSDIWIMTQWKGRSTNTLDPHESKITNLVIYLRLFTQRASQIGNFLTFCSCLSTEFTLKYQLVNVHMIMLSNSWTTSRTCQTRWHVRFDYQVSFIIQITSNVQIPIPCASKTSLVKTKNSGKEREQADVFENSELIWKTN